MNNTIDPNLDLCGEDEVVVENVFVSSVSYLTY